MSDIVGAEFSGETIQLDGKVFSKCRFVDCRLVFAGDDNFVFAECGLERCTFEFVGGAKRTIDQLASLHKFGYGPIVETFLDKVRAG